MFADLDEGSPGRDPREFDLCIVGAGVAGISMACRLDGAGIRVGLLEAGGLEEEPEGQALYRALNEGDPLYPLDKNRRRRFGGTSQLWTGWCRPLDESDFEERRWVPDSGWPFGRKELDPWYLEAQKVCEAGPFAYDFPSRETAAGASSPLDGLRGFAPRLYCFSPPTRFGPRYRPVLAASRNVEVLLHAPVVRLVPDAFGKRIERIEIRNHRGRSCTVKAGYFVLAMGAVENARLLLASNDVEPRGIGNSSDLVGRYFMEHVNAEWGCVSIRNSVELPPLYRLARPKPVARLGPDIATQAREGMMNGNLMLVPAKSSPSTAGIAAAALAAARENGGETALWSRRRFLAAAVGGLAGTALLYAGCRSRDTGPPGEWKLLLTQEQAPNRESRIALAGERDALGLPVVRVLWRGGDLDRHTFSRLGAGLEEELRRAGILARGATSKPAKFDWPPPPLQGMRGHHMGTTRMHATPRRGVTDSQGRIFEKQNLYIAGSSLFPTSGAGTPTLPIVALALRQAEHLRRRLAQDAAPFTLESR